MDILEDQTKTTFIQLVLDSIQKHTFVKLTFSKAVKRDNSLAKNIYGRLVQLKKGIALSCTLRFDTQDFVENYFLSDNLEGKLEQWLGYDYSIATLLTKTEDIVLKYNKKRQGRIQRIQVKERSQSSLTTHNIPKKHLISLDSPFLQKLGVTNQHAKLTKNYQDKFKQINKYIEVIDSLLKQANLLNGRQPIKIVDMGSGKGYLTFALYSHLKALGHSHFNILGVELRFNLVDFCNQQARDLNWQKQLVFQSMDIMDYEERDLDVLIALHACDIATDIAIAQGIKNNANLIVTAPCCHKQIRKTMQPQTPWQHILQQGILLERQAELVTDAIRALLLELAGYKVKVFEFISTEHTAKNVMITAIKNTKGLSRLEQQKKEEDINSLKCTFGIKQHYLEQLLV